MNSWLKLYGYDIENMIGSSYTRTQLHQPSAKVSSPQLTPQFNVVSGLQCIVEKVFEPSKNVFFRELTPVLNDLLLTFVDISFF